MMIFIIFLLLLHMVRGSGRRPRKSKDSSNQAELRVKDWILAVRPRSEELFLPLGDPILAHKYGWLKPLEAVDEVSMVRVEYLHTLQRAHGSELEVLDHFINFELGHSPSVIAFHYVVDRDHDRLIIKNTLRAGSEVIFKGMQERRKQAFQLAFPLGCSSKSLHLHWHSADKLYHVLSAANPYHLQRIFPRFFVESVGTRYLMSRSNCDGQIYPSHDLSILSVPMQTYLATSLAKHLLAHELPFVQVDSVGVNYTMDNKICNLELLIKNKSLATKSFVQRLKAFILPIKLYHSPDRTIAVHPVIMECGKKLTAIKRVSDVERAFKGIESCILSRPHAGPTANIYIDLTRHIPPNTLLSSICRYILLEPHFIHANAIVRVKLDGNRLAVTSDSTTDCMMALSDTFRCLLTFLFDAFPDYLKDTAILKEVQSVEPVLLTAEEFHAAQRYLPQIIKEEDNVPEVEVLLQNSLETSDWVIVKDNRALIHLRPPNQQFTVQVFIRNKSYKRSTATEWRFFVPNGEILAIWNAVVAGCVFSTDIFSDKLAFIHFTPGRTHCMLSVTGLEGVGILGMLKGKKGLVNRDPPGIYHKVATTPFPIYQVDGVPVALNYVGVKDAFTPIASFALGTKVSLVYKSNANNLVDYDEFTMEAPRTIIDPNFPASDPQADFFFNLMDATNVGQAKLEAFFTPTNQEDILQFHLRSYFDSKRNESNYLTRITALSLIRHLIRRPSGSALPIKFWIVAARLGNDPAWGKSLEPLDPLSFIEQLMRHYPGIEKRFLAEPSCLVLRNPNAFAFSPHHVMLKLEGLPRPFEVLLNARSIWLLFPDTLLAKEIYQVSIHNDGTSMTLDFQLSGSDKVDLMAACLWLLGRAWEIADPVVILMPEGTRFMSRPFASILSSIKQVQREMEFGFDYPRSFAGWSLEARLLFADETFSSPLPVVSHGIDVVALLLGKEEVFSIGWHYYKDRELPCTILSMQISPAHLECSLHRIFSLQAKRSDLLILKLIRRQLAQVVQIEFGIPLDGPESQLAWTELLRDFVGDNIGIVQPDTVNDEDHDRVVEGVGYGLVARRAGGTQHKLMGLSGLGRILVSLTTSFIKALQSLGYTLEIVSETHQHAHDTVLAIQVPQAYLGSYLQHLIVPKSALPNPVAISVIKTDAGLWTLKVVFDRLFEEDEKVTFRSNLNFVMLHPQMRLEEEKLKGLPKASERSMIRLQQTVPVECELSKLPDFCYEEVNEKRRVVIHVPSSSLAQLETVFRVAVDASVKEIVRLCLLIYQQQPSLSVAIPQIYITPGSPLFVHFFIDTTHQSFDLRIGRWLSLFFLTNLSGVECTYEGRNVEMHEIWEETITSLLPIISDEVPTIAQAIEPTNLLALPSLPSSLSYWVWNEGKGGWQFMALFEQIPHILIRSIGTVTAEWLIADSNFFTLYEGSKWSVAEVASSKLDSIWPQVIPLLREHGMAMRLRPATSNCEPQLHLFFPDGFYKGELRVPNGVNIRILSQSVDLNVAKASGLIGSATMTSAYAYRLSYNGRHVLSGDSFLDLLREPNPYKPWCLWSQMMAPLREMIKRQKEMEAFSLTWELMEPQTSGSKFSISFDPSFIDPDELLAALSIDCPDLQIPPLQVIQLSLSPLKFPAFSFGEMVGSKLRVTMDRNSIATIALTHQSMNDLTLEHYSRLLFSCISMVWLVKRVQKEVPAPFDCSWNLGVGDFKMEIDSLSLSNVSLVLCQLHSNIPLIVQMLPEVPVNTNWVLSGEVELEHLGGLVNLTLFFASISDRMEGLGAIRIESGSKEGLSFPSRWLVEWDLDSIRQTRPLDFFIASLRLIGLGKLEWVRLQEKHARQQSTPLCWWKRSAALIDLYKRLSEIYLREGDDGSALKMGELLHPRLMLPQSPVWSSLREGTFWSLHVLQEDESIPIMFIRDPQLLSTIKMNLPKLNWRGKTFSLLKLDEIARSDSLAFIIVYLTYPSDECRCIDNFKTLMDRILVTDESFVVGAAVDCYFGHEEVSKVAVILKREKADLNLAKALLSQWLSVDVSECSIETGKDLIPPAPSHSDWAVYLGGSLVGDFYSAAQFEMLLQLLESADQVLTIRRVTLDAALDHEWVELDTANWSVDQDFVTALLETLVVQRESISAIEFSPTRVLRICLAGELPWRRLIARALLLAIVPSPMGDYQGYSTPSLILYGKDGKVDDKLDIDGEADLDQLTGKCDQVKIAVEIRMSDKIPPGAKVVSADLVRPKEGDASFYINFPLWILQQSWSLLHDHRQNAALLQIRLVNTSALRCHLEWTVSTVGDTVMAWPSTMGLFLESIGVQIVNQPSYSARRKYQEEQPLEIYSRLDDFVKIVQIQLAKGKRIRGESQDPMEVDSEEPVDAESEAGSENELTQSMQVMNLNEVDLPTMAQSLLFEHAWWYWEADFKAEHVGKKMKTKHALKLLDTPRKALHSFLDSLDDLGPCLAFVRERRRPLKVFAWEAWPVEDRYLDPNLRCAVEGKAELLEQIWMDLLLQTLGHDSELADWIAAVGHVDVRPDQRIFLVWFDETPPEAIISQWMKKSAHSRLHSWVVK